MSHPSTTFMFPRLPLTRQLLSLRDLGGGHFGSHMIAISNCLISNCLISIAYLCCGKSGILTDREILDSAKIENRSTG
jgi:hypothetical protein